ncbi:MAG: hypothetical protein AVDCRST_MAG93-7798 [uncultured Chloroflexia bacterium]|uniref:Uncharacterized protein n=1 Tax=uncultured Chloroflexia bacterium TaxID=1672391 RepID=A0A6J4MQD2_9CHLR|nr:MAG: hypothetical protein AVDCRST_MAG93-7798 [uncultured Chloroflexia bacterium]
MFGSCGECSTLRFKVMRLAEQMREREAEVEGRIAPVDDLMVEQHQAILIHQDILGAVITMDEGQLRCQRPIDQLLDERCGFWHLGGGVAIVGLDA